jgi:hypothetical protein
MAKPRKVAYSIISPTEEPELYDLLRELVESYHDHLINARISLAWCYSWKPDADGQLILGKCKKAADLDRQLHDRDFIILLNQQAWYGAGFDDRKRWALLDHELCHADVEVDSEGEQVVNAAGRPVYRIRRHDLEEFQAIVQRHGCWKADIEEFAKEALKRGKTPLLADQDDVTVSVSIEGGPATAPLPLREFSRRLRKVAAGARG